jgi:hypothetical protein
MTEKKWLETTDWRPLRRAKSRIDNKRKTRLFCAACCRRVAHMFDEPRSDAALAVAERLADGLVTEEKRAEAEQTSHEAINYPPTPLAQAWARDAVWRTVRADNVWDGAESCLKATSHNTDEVAAQTVLFRDIFGNPYRKVKCEQSWLTSDVLLLANGIYSERAFDRMPILADAIQDAGCTCDAVLDHCRAADPHALGCWVLDLLLDKDK